MSSFERSTSPGRFHGSIDAAPTIAIIAIAI
jgi:hypothetical protein